MDPWSSWSFGLGIIVALGAVVLGRWLSGEPLSSRKSDVDEKLAWPGSFPFRFPFLDRMSPETLFGGVLVLALSYVVSAYWHHEALDLHYLSFVLVFLWGYGGGRYWAGREWAWFLASVAAVLALYVFGGGLIDVLREQVWQH
jgi:hypothetical protein